MRKILSNKWFWNPSCLAVAILVFDAAPLVFGSIPVMKIDSDITTSQVWNNKTVYHITTAINLKALLVIEPGTIVALGPQSVILVNNGGTLIAKGTPDKLIVFTPDYLYFNSPEQVGYYWQRFASKVSHASYYPYAILVEKTASIATTIRYCMIEGADAGIWIKDIRLEHPIENNYLCGNSRGIMETGPRLTNIRNNLFFYNMAAGIEIYLMKVPKGLDLSIYFGMEIKNNTCDSGQLDGIRIHGVSDPNETPGIALINNIVSNNDEYGLNLIGKFKFLTIRNTGYYGNGTNIDIRHIFDEENPVFADQYPFTPVVGSNVFPGGPLAHHYLVPDCSFVNAGNEWAENTPYRGMSTNANGSPDRDKIDLGFHRIDWERVGPDPSSDPFPDFTPIIEPMISPDNSAQWGVGFAVKGCPPETSGVYGYVNGRFVGWLQDCSCMGDCCPKHMYVDISEWSPRQHVKFVVTDSNGHYYFSPLFEITDKSPLSYCVFPSHCNLGDPLPFGIINTGTADTTITVETLKENGRDLKRQTVWSNTYRGHSIAGEIPARVIADCKFEAIIVISTDGAKVEKRVPINDKLGSTPY